MRMISQTTDIRVFEKRNFAKGGSATWVDGVLSAFILVTSFCPSLWPVRRAVNRAVRPKSPGPATPPREADQDRVSTSTGRSPRVEPEDLAAMTFGPTAQPRRVGRCAHDRRVAGAPHHGSGAGPDRRRARDLRGAPLHGREPPSSERGASRAGLAPLDARSVRHNDGGPALAELGRTTDQVRLAAVQIELLEAVTGETELDVDVPPADGAIHVGALVDEVLQPAHGPPPCAPTMVSEAARRDRHSAHPCGPNGHSMRPWRRA